MGNTNYFSSIVKILENPVKTISENNITILEFRAEISQFRQNKIINLLFWGKLADNVKNYYQVNDYILIEGYLCIKENKNNNFSKDTLKKINVNILKIYPLYLNLNQSYIYKEIIKPRKLMKYFSDSINNSNIFNRILIFYIFYFY